MKVKKNSNDQMTRPTDLSVCVCFRCAKREREKMWNYSYAVVRGDENGFRVRVLYWNAQVK